MGRTLTNNLSLQYAIEQTLGVLPGSPEWKLLEPNEISTYGPSITNVARDPISKNRQREKGTTTDLDSNVEFAADWTHDSFEDFIEGFVFANFTGQDKVVPTATTASAYTIPTGTAYTANTLCVGFGWTNSENNGLKVVDTGSTTTSVPIVGGGLVAETPGATQNVSLEIAGFRFPSGDLEVNASGNLTTTTTDFTTLGLIVGQMIWVGGDATANKFAIADNRGFARITAIAANLLTIDKKSTTFTTDTGTGKLIDLYFGRFLKNVAVDDANYLERSFQFEAAYENLQNPSGDEYEYAKGNYCNTVGFDLPLTDKATATFAFVGTDTPELTTTRATNAATPLVPVKTTALNTSQDILRLRMLQTDETGITTDFKSANLALNNNASPEKVLGQLGAKYINVGNLEVDIESELLFTNSAVVSAIRNNETLTMDFSVRNDNGSIVVDIPSMTLSGGEKSFPVNESITIAETAQAFRDSTYNASIMISLFPYTPAS